MFRTTAVVLLAAAAPASAGWVVIKNDTPHVLVVQETCDPAGPKKPCRTVRLMPGETHREHHTQAGEKTIRVYALNDPSKPLYSGKLSWPADDAAVQLQPDGPLVRLAKAVLPASLLPKSASPAK